MSNWISCDFGPGEKFLFCDECGWEALHHHGLAIDNDEIREVPGTKLNNDARCCHCNIGKEQEKKDV